VVPDSVAPGRRRLEVVFGEPPNSAEATATGAAAPSPVVERQRGRRLLGALTAQVAARRADGSRSRCEILWNLMVSHFAPFFFAFSFLFEFFFLYLSSFFSPSANGTMEKAR